MRQWLDCECFEPISLDLRDKLEPNRELIIIIETEEDSSNSKFKTSSGGLALIP